MKTSLGQLSSKHIDPKIWSNIFENVKPLLPYSFDLFGKQYKNVLLSWRNSWWFHFICLSLFCNIVSSASHFPSFTYTVAHPTHFKKACFSPTIFCSCFVYLSYLTLIRCILLYFCYYLWNAFNEKLIYASNRAGWKYDPYGLSSTLCDLTCWISDVVYPHQNEINICFLMSFFPLSSFVLLRDLSHKNAWINQHIYSLLD